MRLPTASMITRQLDKPALVPWAANAACDYINEKIPGIVKLREERIGTVDINELQLIVNEARKNYRTISAAAINIGKEVHTAIENYLKRSMLAEVMETQPLLSDKAEIAFNAFLDWLKEMKITDTIGVEYRLRTPRYNGKCDWICKLRDKIYVIDFKVAKGVYPENRYQVAAYRIADPSIEGCGILRLDRETGEPDWHDTSETYDLDKQVFLALTDLWYAINCPTEGE